jgi:hypothetical protein
MSNNHSKIYLSSLFIHVTHTHTHHALTHIHTHTHTHDDLLLKSVNTYKIDIKLIYVLL